MDSAHLVRSILLCLELTDFQMSATEKITPSVFDYHGITRSGASSSRSTYADVGKETPTPFFQPSRLTDIMPTRICYAQWKSLRGNE